MSCKINEYKALVVLTTNVGVIKLLSANNKLI